MWCVRAQWLRHVWRFASPWTAARQASLPFTISQSLLKLMCIESMMPSNHLILCHPLLLPSIFPSIRVFSSESGLFASCGQSIGCFSFSISPSKQCSELISFKTDRFDPLAFWGTPKSLLQHQSLKASVLRHLAFLWATSQVHDNWKNHSFDYMDLYWQSDVSAF